MFKLEINSAANSFDWRSLCRSFRKFVGTESKVLEIGASDRQRTGQLSQWCGELVGIEYKPERLLKDFENAKFILGDCQKLSGFFESESFDVVLASHVIEHLPDDLAVINEIYHVLKPGGAALLNTPNKKRLTRSLIEFFWRERKFPFKEHIREYTEKDLTRLLKLSKFKNFEIIPIAFGIYGGPIRIYQEQVPKKFRKYANFWETHLFK